MMKRTRHGIILYFAAFSGTLVIYTAVPHFRDIGRFPAVIIVISILMVVNYSHFKVFSGPMCGPFILIMPILLFTLFSSL